MSETDALLRENAQLREEIASLRLRLTNAIHTCEGRTAEQWAGYAHRAEAEVSSLRNQIAQAQRILGTEIEVS